jgi:hypothetical protein
VIFQERERKRVREGGGKCKKNETKESKYHKKATAHDKKREKKT